MCWYVRTDTETNTACTVNTHTGAEVQCFSNTPHGAARASALVKAMETEAVEAEKRAKEQVEQTYEWLEAIDTLRGMIATFEKVASSAKAAQTVGHILEAKIHQSFTVAADQLFMRGYLTRDERIALSSVIGDMLGAFTRQVEPIEGADAVVEPSDVAAIAEKSNRQSFYVVNKETDKPRWVLLSSCNYKDRDGQVVSEAGLRKAVLLSDLLGSHGPLRWWHTKEKGKVLDLGECDFQVVYKGFLIESGTFVSKAVADAIGRVAHNLRVSIGFIHPDTEPDGDGVFHNIAILERSLLPSGAESNPFTSLVVV